MEIEILQEEITVLPNPDVKREQCVKECMGCNRMFSSMDMASTIRKLADGENDDVIGDVCIAYQNTKAQWRNYRIEKGMKKVKGKDVEILYHNSPCNLASHVKHSPKVKNVVQGNVRAGQQRHT